MPAEIPDPDFEPEWLWRTRITAEAACVASVKGCTPRERFAIYERLILAACEELKRRESAEHSGSIAEPTPCLPGKLLYNFIEVEESIMLSGFEPTDTNYSADYNMNNAKDTIISQCLLLASTALERSWTFHHSTEALFWFRSVFKVDPQNLAARLGSARVYQYIASQPWWHNDVSLAKSAASKALALLEGPTRPQKVIEFERESDYRSHMFHRPLFSTFQQYLY